MWGLETGMVSHDGGFHQGFHTLYWHSRPVFFLFPGFVLSVFPRLSGAVCHVGMLPVAGQPLQPLPHPPLAVHWRPHPDSVPLPVPVLSGCSAQG